ncbi:MAG: AsmA family protein, partial [Actinobacteria bacterium]|nr:AsmA family protein [Actinomycetota bacterium]NIS29250.1 AsmA family protein [Actinomycetota bacterium]NIT94409.1 AsmA family protein [Actinomycetota bacterium]NIU64643.1 AsmA family protein [Actinomycetota bacterium]NIV85831.1 AsmA family protein [Actinomycetota bacterium]
AALLAFPLAALALAVFVDGDELTAWLEPRVSGALNRPVTVGEAGLAMLPRPGLRIGDVRVGGGEGSEVPSVIAVRDIRLEVAFLPLFTGRVVVDRIGMSGVDVHLAISEEGVSNFGDLVPESRVVETPVEGPVAFVVDA